MTHFVNNMPGISLKCSLEFDKNKNNNTRNNDSFLDELTRLLYDERYCKEILLPRISFMITKSLVFLFNAYNIKSPSVFRSHSEMIFLSSSDTDDV